MSENQNTKQHYWLLSAEIRLLINQEGRDSYPSAILQNAVLTTDSAFVSAADLQRANRIVIQQFLGQVIASGEKPETTQPQGATFVAISHLGHMTKAEWEANVTPVEVAV